MKKFLYGIALFIFGLLGVVHLTIAQGIGTIPQLQQFVSTTSPTSAITQQVYGKPLYITGLSPSTSICTDINGLITTTGCPAGGAGSGGGTFSTTSSQVPGRLINYPNNSTDIVNIGSTSTTTGKFWFDPNVSLASFLGRFNFQFASGTALTLSGSAYLPKLGNLTTNGFIKTSGGDGTLSVDTATYLTSALTSLNGLSGASQTFATTSSNGGFGFSSSGTVHTLNIPTASASSLGLLPSADWSTFNGKQSAGNYITALTGDVTASGPGSSASTLATVNSNVGSFTNPNVTVNGKGLITAISNGTGGGISDPFTHPGSLQSATTSLMLLNGNASTTGLGVSGPGFFNTDGVSTSTFSGAVQIGGTTGDDALKITSRTGGYPSSSSLGGMVNLTNTNNLGQALNVFSNAGVGRTNDLLNILNNNTANDQRALFITQNGTRSAALFNCTNATRVSGGECINITDVSGANRTAFGISGAPIGLGLAKIQFNGIGNTSSSALSIDMSTTSAVAQGIFIDSTGGGWSGKILNLRANGTEYATLLTNGNLGLSSSTPGSLLSIGGDGTGINFFDNATSSFSKGINIASGCFSIAGTCVAGSTGTGITTLGPVGQGQTGASQILASSTTGTDFTITSTGNTHTFNLPSASASNRGLLTSTDWSTFNNKQSALTFTYPLVNTAGTVTDALSTTSSNTWAGTQTFTNAPVLTSLATAAGTFLATDGSGNIIATTTPSGSGSTTSTVGQTIIGNTSANTQVGTSTILISPTSRVGFGGITNPVALISVGFNGVASTTVASGGINFGDPTADLYRSANGVIKVDGTFTPNNLTMGSGNINMNGGSISSAGNITSSSGTIQGSTGIFNIVRGDTSGSVGLILSASVSGSNQTPVVTVSDTSIGSGHTNTSGSGAALSFSNSFIPTSGTGVYNFVNMPFTVNQTGNSSGISRGMYLNPTLTAAYDYRNIEIAATTYNMARNATTLQSTLDNATTYASSTTATLTNAYQHSITGAPIASTNVTIATSTALFIGGGAVNGGGTVTTAWGAQIFAPTGATTNNALGVYGKVYMPNLTASSGLQSGIVCLDANGQLINESVACLASSLRFKKDINPITDSLSEVLALKPVSYFYKPEFNGSLQSNPNYNGEQVGFIAEDVQKIDPRLVAVETTGADIGKPHTVRYENMTALLAGSIQQLNTKIENIQIGKAVRSAEENWQDILIGLLVIGFIYQQIQIKRLTK